MADKLIQALRSFSGIMHGDLLVVDDEVEKWAHYIRQGYVAVVAEIATHGDQVADTAEAVAAAVPEVAPEAAVVAVVADDASKVAKDLQKNQVKAAVAEVEQDTGAKKK